MRVCDCMCMYIYIYLQLVIVDASIHTCLKHKTVSIAPRWKHNCTPRLRGAVSMARERTAEKPLLKICFVSSSMSLRKRPNIWHVITVNTYPTYGNVYC